MSLSSSSSSSALSVKCHYHHYSSSLIIIIIPLEASDFFRTFVLYILIIIVSLSVIIIIIILYFLKNAYIVIINGNTIIIIINIPSLSHQIIISIINYYHWLFLHMFLSWSTATQSSWFYLPHYKDRRGWWVIIIYRFIYALVFTKSVDSNFGAFWLAHVTRNILGYSLFWDEIQNSISFCYSYSYSYSYSYILYPTDLVNTKTIMPLSVGE